jgi:hypothetical protein
MEGKSPNDIDTKRKKERKRENGGKTETVR